MKNNYHHSLHFLWPNNSTIEYKFLKKQIRVLQNQKSPQQHYMQEKKKIGNKPEYKIKFPLRKSCHTSKIGQRQSHM